MDNKLLTPTAMASIILKTKYSLKIYAKKLYLLLVAEE